MPTKLDLVIYMCDFCRSGFEDSASCAEHEADAHADDEKEVRDADAFVTINDELMVGAMQTLRVLNGEEADDVDEVREDAPDYEEEEDEDKDDSDYNDGCDIVKLKRHNKKRPREGNSEPPAVTPKRRGRPPKNSPAKAHRRMSTGMPPAKGVLSPASKKAKRLAMEDKEDEMDSSAEPPVKRGRGRPPKSPKATSAKSPAKNVSFEDAGDEQPKKRGPGRPPKNGKKATSVKVVIKEGEDGPKKRGRGRPPKERKPSPVEEDEDTDEGVEASTLGEESSGVAEPIEVEQVNFQFVL